GSAARAANAERITEEGLRFTPFEAIRKSLKKPEGQRVSTFPHVSLFDLRPGPSSDVATCEIFATPVKSFHLITLRSGFPALVYRSYNRGQKWLATSLMSPSTGGPVQKKRAFSQMK